MAKSVVCGGLTYLRLMSWAARRIARAKRLGGEPRGLDVAQVGGVLDADVVLLRQLGVDGQPHAAAGIVFGAREADGVLDHLGVAGLDVDVLLVLPGRQDLAQQGAQLHLGPRAARLDVGEHALEVADPGRQALHLAEALLHGLELVADQLERLAETLLERDVELLVHGLAHLFELLLVAVLQLAHAGVEGGADAVERGLVGLAELLEAGGDTVELGALDVAHALERDGQRVVGGREAARELVAGLARGATGLFAPLTELVAQRVGAALRAARRPRQKGDEQHGVERRKGEEQPGDR